MSQISLVKSSPKTLSRVTWVWFGVFCIALVLFGSLSAVILKKPAIFSRVQSIELVVGRRETASIQEVEEFSTSDQISTQIVYRGASEGVKIELVYARLVTDPQFRNGREILAQVSVPLLNTNGERTYQFPAYERKAGNYEITLQSDGEIFEKTRITLRNE